MADIIYPDETPSGVIGDANLPANYDITFWKGDKQEFFLEFTDSNGAAIDLTGLTPSAVIRASFNSPTIYSFDCTLIETDPFNRIRLYLSSAVSKTIPAGDYIWNFQVTDASGDVRTYLAGDVRVLAEVDG